MHTSKFSFAADLFLSQSSAENAPWLRLRELPIDHSQEVSQKFAQLCAQNRAPTSSWLVSSHILERNSSFSNGDTCDTFVWIVTVRAIMQVRATSVASFVTRWPFPRFWRPSAERLPFLQRHQPAPCFFPRMEYFWAGRPNDNRSLVELLRQGGVIKSQRVAEALEQIDRKLFVPDKIYAYMDNPMPIGFNATISAPHMHALCLQLLENHLQPGMLALDVGSGTGYLTACFAVMVGKEGRVVGVEHIPQLVEQCIENVKASKAAPLLESGRLSFHVGDGRLGWPDEAPYDAIHVGAAASEVPDALLQQLRPGGRMVIPVGDDFQELRVIDKQNDGSLKEWCETSVRYVPLTSRNEQLSF